MQKNAHDLLLKSLNQNECLSEFLVLFMIFYANKKSQNIFQAVCAFLLMVQAREPILAKSVIFFLALVLFFLYFVQFSILIKKF